MVFDSAKVTGKRRAAAISEMMDVRAVAERAAKWRAKEELRDALRILETNCAGPRQAPAGASDLVRAILKMTLWPSWDDLLRLDSSVKTLSRPGGKKLSQPLWKAFEGVDKRWRRFRLIRRLDALVSRARKLLDEAAESDLRSVCREARGNGERASEAKRFLADLRRIQKEPKAASKIQWCRYRQFLSRLGDNKGFRLRCGDSAASERVICYARALEIIVDDENRKELLNKAEPLLRWILFLGNPDYADVLKRDDFMEWAAQQRAERASDERAEHARKLGRVRVRRFRARKITR
jgi:hypothetical protein